MPADAVFDLLGVVLLFATLCVAAVTDILHRKVYNWLTVPAIAFGLTLGYASGDWGSVALGPGGGGLLDRLAGFSVGFGLFFLAWFGGKGVAGGDVKLMGAIGALRGLHFVVSAMFWSCLVGAILAVWVLLGRGRLLWGLRRSLRHTLSLRPEPVPPEEEDAARLRIPMGAAIAFGSLLAWFLLEAPTEVVAP
ncbi:MAG: prepilin peptidase [Planctomycetota bacterium]|nr:MAG: prepilin peptidase [Planctomycetota bacterium]